MRIMSTTAYQFETFEAFSPFSDVGPYRAADYWRLPEGEPVELIKGRFVVSPSPNVLHQTIVLLLAESLLKASRKTGGKALFAPMDVILSDDTILQPDLLYVSKLRRHIIKQRVEGAPDLVIEIISGTGLARSNCQAGFVCQIRCKRVLDRRSRVAAHRVSSERGRQVHCAIASERPVPVATLV